MWMLVVIDEYTRECMAIYVALMLKSDDVLERLAWLMATRGVSGHIRSHGGAWVAGGDGRQDALDRAGLAARK